MRMLSGDAFRRDLERGLANTDIERDDLRHNAFATSPSSIKTAYALHLFRWFAFFSPLNLLIENHVSVF